MTDYWAFVFFGVGVMAGNIGANLWIEGMGIFVICVSLFFQYQSNKDKKKK